MTFCRPSRFSRRDRPEVSRHPVRRRRPVGAREGGNDAPVRTAYGGRGGYRKQEAGRKDYTGNARTYYSGREQSRGERSSERPAQGGFRHAAAPVREMSPVVPTAVSARGQPPAGRPEQRIPSAPRPAESAGAETKFEVGMLVRHDKFGTGRVTQVEEWSGDVKITVEFDGAGRKTLLRRFAKLTPLRRG